jgi:endonuclease III
MSLRVYDNARDVLSQLFSDDQAEDNFSRNAAEHWQAVAGKLRDKIGKGKVGKSRDVDMVVSALSYINKIPYKNIVAHSATQIRGGKLKQHYQELQSRSGDNGITQVGPKIAAFYLRDVVSLCQLSGSVDNASAFCLQAVDTWVQKVAEKLGIVRVGADTSEVQNAIVGLCEKEQISALRFNQGAWFTGYHSFDLVLDLLSK